MPTISETGHAVNVENFKILKDAVAGFGANYNPSNVRLQIANLTSRYEESLGRLDAVIETQVFFNSRVNERKLLFDTNKVMSTKIYNALVVSGADPEKIADAKFFHRKLQGKRAQPITAVQDPTTPVRNTISASQQSYIQQIQHFAGFISLLQSEPLYNPNEAALTIATLTAHKNNLDAKNNAVSTAHVQITNARFARNGTLYENEVGIIATANSVKSYIKSVFSGNSPEYNMVRAIQFRKY